MRRKRRWSTLVAMRIPLVARVGRFFLDDRLVTPRMLRQVWCACLWPALVVMRVLLRETWPRHQTQHDRAGNACLRSHLMLSFCRRFRSFSIILNVGKKELARLEFPCVSIALQIVSARSFFGACRGEQ